MTDAPAGRVRLDRLDTTITVAGDPGRPGERVDVLVRPERLRLVESRDVPAPLVTLELEVESTVNYGDSLLVLGKAKGQPVRVRVPGAAPAAVHDGAKLLVAWGPEDVHVVRA